ncbi:MAG: GTPase HflX [Candidatus Thorarchaeota archaeon]
MERQRAIIIQRRNPASENLLAEFEALASTAGYDVVGRFDIVGRHQTRYGIGAGKVDEIGEYIRNNEVDVVLVSPDLTSSQMYRLMRAWKTDVRNRGQVILEIFDLHARTPQAKLQIEEARLRYELPFIRHQLRKRLQREHTGARPVGQQVGAGEDILNLRMMEVRRRIAIIRDKLRTISDAEDLKRKKRIREGYYEVALAGYTNAGKSTLHRALTQSDAEVSDQMFTTLSTKTSRMSVTGRNIVVTDSVGFVSDLPRSLLQAFNTTLREIGTADVVLLVVDGSEPSNEMVRKTEACFSTLESIGVLTPNLAIVLNKIDMIDPALVPDRLQLLSHFSREVVPVSAKTGHNIDLLIDQIISMLPSEQRFVVTLPYGSEGMRLLSWIHEVARIEREEFGEDQILVEVILSKDVAEHLARGLPEGSLKCIDSPPEKSYLT